MLHFPGKEKSAEFEKVLQGKLQNKDFDFRGGWFPDDVPFARVNFTAVANFHGATFSGRANFSYATFSADVNFSAVTFSGNAAFDVVTFSGNADFSAATFNAESDFSIATFSGNADFSAATFNAETDFSIGTSFSGNTDFSFATFSAEADFGSANFGGEADFEGATFGATAIFSSATFSARAGFSCTFSGVANFTPATFSAEASFESATFGGEVHFSHATFSAIANFSFSAFSRQANFIVATFSAAANFQYSTFSAAANFRYTTFSERASFFSATFEDSVEFAGSEEYPVFTDTSRLDLQFARIEKPDRVSFHTLSLRPHWFVNVDASKFDFTNVGWPEYTKVDLDRRSIEKEIKNLRSQNKKLPYPNRLLSVACWRLATNAEENHRYPEASDFRYMAMDASRRERWRFAFWRLNVLYWVASGYGERIWRATVWLILILLLSAAIYTQVGFARPEARLAAESSGEATRREDVNARLNFGRALIYSAEVIAFQKPEPRPATTTAHGVVLLETILGPVQAALLLLAIRRKFMR